MSNAEQKYKNALAAHKEVINQIRELDKRLDSLSPFELSKLEYMYTKAERHAWTIAGYFKSQQKFYEGMAEVSQGTTYKNLRENKSLDKTGTDAQYESRIPKGHCLVEASTNDGDYITWKGFATSYEGARNSIKDMLKAVGVEGGNQ